LLKFSHLVVNKIIKAVQTGAAFPFSFKKVFKVIKKNLHFKKKLFIMHLHFAVMAELVDAQR
ncbi:MAG: hypothetical protein IJD25_02840, partial [Alphaproteobacteria bacterium]|nr:hypothetical protein [Alphaproteobacteria bacterium]